MLQEMVGSKLCRILEDVVTSTEKVTLGWFRHLKGTKGTINIKKIKAKAL